MKKYLKIFAWVCGAVAIVMMLLGIIAFLAGGRLMNHNWANYFYPAYNFMILGIFSLLLILVENKNS